jgi:hypothetical protein
VPHYPNAKFPAVLVFSEIYQGKFWFLSLQNYIYIYILLNCRDCVCVFSLGNVWS